MDDLNAENKRLAKKVRDVLRADQDRMEAHKKRSNMTDTERSELKMRQTQLSSQSKVSGMQFCL